MVSPRFGVQAETDAVWGSAPAAPVRGMSLALSTTGGEVPTAPTVAGSTYRATSAIAFDRSVVNAAAGYRFLVSYSGDLVLDASPHVTPTDVVVLR